MPSSSGRCAAELKFLYDYQFKNWSTHVEGEMQMNEITSREVFFTAVFEAGISICKTSVHTCWATPVQGAGRLVDTWKLLHRHDSRDGVQELPSSGHREEDSDFMLMKTYAKLWRLPTYCDFYYVHVLRPPFYRRRRDVGECSRLPVSGSLIFR